MVRTKQHLKRKNKPGPKGYWDDTMAERTYRLSLLGLRDTDLALAFGVSIPTIENWKRTNPEFLEAVQRGKQEADAKVAKSLYKRATGYSHPDTHVTVYKGEVISVPITKHYPPDVGAIVFWLTNRQSTHWANTQKVEHGGAVTVKHQPTDLSDLTAEELSAIKKIGLKNLSLQGVGKN